MFVENKITPQMVEEALAKHPEIKLNTGYMYTDRNECCAIGILVLDEARTLPDKKHVGLRCWDVARRIFSHPYVTGFYEGFDGRTSASEYADQKAFEDGKTCRHYFIEKGLLFS
jgi:hypothetical protein